MTNADLEKIVDTSDEWITSRTGIKERRMAEADMSSAEMGKLAAESAMAMAGVKGKDIDLVIAATVTPDYRLPSNACVIQEQMDLSNAVAFDVVAACAGFINALAVADMHIASGNYKRALVVGTEKLSAITNYEDRATCVLFGDGAGAVVMEASNNGHGVISSFMKSNGQLRPWLWVPTGGVKYPYTADFSFDGSDKIKMNGSDIFRVAVKEMTNAVETVLERAGISTDEVSVLIPHQANLRIIDAVAKRLKFPKEKIFLNIEKYGNTSAASVPLALDEAHRMGRIKPGDYVAMVAFGGGLIWGAALVKW